MKIAVLGGGVSGLVAAYNLALNSKAHVVLYEATDRVGGWIQTVKHGNGATFELGPNSMRVTGLRGKKVLKFLDEIAMDAEINPITGSHSAARMRYLGLNGELYPLPYSLKSLLYHPKRNSFIKAVLREPFIKGRYSGTDESVYMFFKRRFGPDLAELVSDPICRGILASDARTLGISAMFPDLVRIEYTYRSLVKGFLTEWANANFPHNNPLTMRADKEGWKMVSFQKGMEQLPRALYNMLCDLPNVDIYLDAPVEEVTVQEPNVTVRLPGSVPVHYHHVVSALPAYSLSSTLKHDELPDYLKLINFVDVALVSVEFKDVNFDVPGFGCLIPSYENPAVLGIIFSSCLFPSYDTKEYKSARFTLMLGGEWFAEYFGDSKSCDKNLIKAMALDAIKQYLKISGEPSLCEVDILEKCIPHYTIGHRNLVKHLYRLIKEQDLKLSLVGNSYFGAGVPDCILNAIEHTQPVVNMMEDRYNTITHSV